MYGITYVDRVNVSTAAAQFGAELHLSHTQVGFVFSAFAYPYLVFQIIGGWVGDRFGGLSATQMLQWRAIVVEERFNVSLSPWKESNNY